MNMRRLAMASVVAMLLAAASVIAFAVMTNLWKYPEPAPHFLKTAVYFSFMWPFTLLNYLLPKPECEGATDYDLCGANEWAYILSIPALITTHSLFIYWLLSQAAKRRRP